MNCYVEFDLITKEKYSRGWLMADHINCADPSLPHVLGLWGLFLFTAHIISEAEAVKLYFHFGCCIW